MSLPHIDAMQFELLLADDDGAVTHDLREAEVVRGDVPDESDTGSYRYDPTTDPNDLATQRWALAGPPSSARAYEALKHLIEHRANEQGAEVLPMFEIPEMEFDARTAARWRRRVLHVGNLSERPAYLLLLGDVETITLEAQQSLAGDLFVGRLDLESPEAYEAYAEKVVAAERNARTTERVALYLRNDGSLATNFAQTHLFTPVRKGLSNARAIVDHEGDLDEVVKVARDVDVLFSIGHGRGTPQKGWLSADDQRARQGDLIIGDGDGVDANFVGAQPFVEGGIWVSLACFSAGTPARSLYRAWLHKLGDERARTVLRHVAREGPGFVSAISRAALANRRGPLAHIGHADLAWSYSFEDIGDLGGSHELFARVLSSLRDGARVGVSARVLQQKANATATELQDLVQDEEDGIAVDPHARAYRWMEYHDLRGFVVMGDPATRLSRAGA